MEKFQTMFMHNSLVNECGKFLFTFSQSTLVYCSCVGSFAARRKGTHFTKHDSVAWYEGTLAIL